MKLTILKENLKTALYIVERGIGKNLNLQILNNVLLDAKKNFLNLATTDLEIGIKCWVLAKIEKEGKITVPARFFSNLISLLPEGKIELTEKNQTLYISGPNYKNQIKGQSGEEFPIIPKVDSKDFIEVNTLPFCQGISQVVDFTALTQVRPELAGVYFIFQKDRVQIVATDSFRLAEKIIWFENPLPFQKEISFILPQKAARELINILSEKEGKLKIYFSPHQVQFEYSESGELKPGVCIISRLIEGEYPNYQEIIPQKFETQVILPKNDFLNQIKTASLFSGKINEIQIKANPKTKIIEIFSQNPEIGENRSTLIGKVEGKEVKVAFNYRFLIDGLLNISGQEVIFQLNGEEGPAVLRAIDDRSYLYVVMPIKSS